MTNEERKKYLLGRAEDEYTQIQSYLGKGDWNMVLRKSQESTELYMKAILKLMNVEFPKEHDLGRYFVDILTRKGVEIDTAEQHLLKRLSAELAEKRAPAYYGEEFYTEQEARMAAQGAQQVREIAHRLLARLEGR